MTKRASCDKMEGKESDEMMQANAFDMVVVPEELLREAPLRTVVDVLSANALREAVCLCGCWTPREDAVASQYELFRRFCRCAPMLEGTRVLLRSQWLLRQVWQIELPLSEETCQTVWLQTAERLQSETGQWERLFLGEETPMFRCNASVLPRLAPLGTPVLDGNSLLPSTPTTLSRWQAQLAETADAFAACGCGGVALNLPVDYALRDTDIYHAEQALQQRKRNREEECCLYFQLLRTLCTVCRTRGWFLFLQVDGCGSQARRLLECLERSVGLPRMVWFVKRADAMAELLSFFSVPREMPAAAAVVAEELVSERELALFTDALWARFPKACTVPLCHTDVRYFAYEKERLRRLF